MFTTTDRIQPQKLVSCLFMALLGLLANAAVPQAEVVTGEMLLFQDIPRVVTASRQAVTVLESPATSTIITREDILHSGFNSTSELLRFVAGVDLFKASSAGPNVGIRGVNGVQANHVLMLVDGRPIFNPERNSNQYSLIPEFPNDIERIEVVRGPGSALYGSHAFAGIINIITRAPEDIDGIDIMASPGTFNSGLYNFDAGKKIGSLTYKLLGGWTQEGSSGDHGNQVKGLLKFSGELGYSWEPGRRADLSFGVTSGKIAVLPMYSLSDFDQEGVDAFLRGQLAYDDTHLDIWWRHHHSSAVLNYYFREQHHNWDFDNLNVNGYHKFRWLGHETVVGAEIRSAWLGATSYGSWHKQFLYGIYLEDRWSLPWRLNLFLSARYDHHPLAGGTISPHISLVKQLSANQSLRFTVSQAFKHPSYLQNYISQNGQIPGLSIRYAHTGNRNVDPEKIVSVEGAYQLWNTSGLQVTLAAFYNKYSDIIDFKFTKQPDLWTLTYDNMYDMHQYGGELDLSYRFMQGFLVRFNYSYVWKQKKDCITFGPVPTNQINGEVRYHHASGMWVDLRMHWQDDAEYSSGIKIPSAAGGLSGSSPSGVNTVHSIEDLLATFSGWHEMDSYTYGDLAVGYMPPERPWSITCAVHNLFHNRSKESPGSVRPDTTFTGRITWHF